MAGRFLQGLSGTLHDQGLLISSLARSAPPVYRPLGESYKAFLRGAVHERTAQEQRKQLTPLEEAAHVEEVECAEVLAAITPAYRAASMRLAPPARAPSLASLPLQPDGPCPRLEESFLARCTRGQVAVPEQDREVRRVLVARTVWDLRAELQRKGRQVDLRLSRVRAHQQRAVRALCADARAARAAPSQAFRRFFDPPAGLDPREAAAETVLFEAGCALGAHVGRAYLTWHRVAFGASLLGYRTRKSWPWSTIRAVEQSATAVGVGKGLTLHLVGGDSTTLTFPFAGRRAFLLAALLLRMHRAPASRDPDAELADAELVAMVDGHGTRSPAAARGHSPQTERSGRSDGGDAHGLSLGQRVRVMGRNGQPLTMVVTANGLQPEPERRAPEAEAEDEEENVAEDEQGEQAEGGERVWGVAAEVEGAGSDAESEDGPVWETPDMASFLVRGSRASVQFGASPGKEASHSGRGQGAGEAAHGAGEGVSDGSRNTGTSESCGTHGDIAGAASGSEWPVPSARRLSSDEPAPVSSAAVEVNASPDPSAPASLREGDGASDADSLPPSPRRAPPGSEGEEGDQFVSRDGSLPLTPQRPRAETSTPVDAPAPEAAPAAEGQGQGQAEGQEGAAPQKKGKKKKGKKKAARDAEDVSFNPYEEG